MRSVEHNGDLVLLVGGENHKTGMKPHEYEVRLAPELPAAMASHPMQCTRMLTCISCSTICGADLRCMLPMPALQGHLQESFLCTSIREFLQAHAPVTPAGQVRQAGAVGAQQVAGSWRGAVQVVWPGAPSAPLLNSVGALVSRLKTMLHARWSACMDDQEAGPVSGYA